MPVFEIHSNAVARGRRMIETFSNQQNRDLAALEGGHCMRSGAPLASRIARFAVCGWLAEGFLRDDALV
jgi:hypothetical protein